MALDTSKFLGGDGSVGNPYIIHNADALLALIGYRHLDQAVQNKHFVLVSNIDLTYLEYFDPQQTSFNYSTFDGHGHQIRLPPIKCLSFNQIIVGSVGVIKNTHIEFNGSQSGSYDLRGFSTGFENNLVTGFVESRIDSIVDGSSTSNKTNLFNLVPSITPENITPFGSWPANTSYYIEGTCKITADASDGLVLSSNALTAASYPNLSDEFWDKIDGSLPSLKIKPYNGLPVTRVAGISKLDGVPAKRRITVQDSNGGRIARTYSDELTGEFSIQTSPHKTGLTVIVDDEIGTEIQASKAYTVGQIVHHADYAGIAYVCTTAGTTGATLPETNTYPESGTITIGTAVFTAKPINKPQIFSPVRPEVILEA